MDGAPNDREWEIRNPDGTPATGFYATVADTFLNVMPGLATGRRIYILNPHDRRSLSHEELPRLMAALDIPDGAQLLAYELDGAALFRGGHELDGTPVAGEDWHGYTLTLIGLATYTPNLNGPVVRLYFDTFDIAEPVFLQVRCAVVTCDQTVARLDYRWHPETGVHISVRELQRATTKSGQLSIPAMKRESEVALRGLALIEQLFVTGNPSGNNYALPEDDPQCVARSYCRLRDERADHKRPSQEDVAADLRTTKPTLRKYMRAHDIPWPPPCPER